MGRNNWRTGLWAAILATAFLAAGSAMALERPMDWVYPSVLSIPNHREIWRSVMIELSGYAKNRQKNFIVLMHGGSELVVKGEREVVWDMVQDPRGRMVEKRLTQGVPFRPFIKLLDGVIVDGLYCGDFAFDVPVDEAVKKLRDENQTLAAERARGVSRLPVASANFGPFSNDPQVELKRAAEIRRKLEIADKKQVITYAAMALRDEGRLILSNEKCADAKQGDRAFANGQRDHVVSHISAGTALSKVPKGHAWGENGNAVTNMSSAKNWFASLKGEAYASKAEWLMALENSNYDVLVVDVSQRGTDPLTKDDVRGLKFKHLGSQRLVLASLPLGRAFDWGWYWKKEWKAGNPAFLFSPDDAEPGAYATDLGDAKWKEILGKYMMGILDMGFDGVVFEDVDTFLWYEDLMPIGQ